MSIYAEKDSVDVADSDVGTGLQQSSGNGNDPHLLDGELVIPDYDDAETAESPAAPVDPAACIAEFKQKREKHERWALGVILNVFVVIYVSAMVLTTWAVRDPDPATNPFKEDINGTAEWTETGHWMYVESFAIMRWVSCAVVSLPLPLEEIVAGFQWTNIAARQFPPIPSLGLWLIYSVADLPTIASVGSIYGWPSVVLVVVMWLRYVIIGRFQFAKEPVHPNRHVLLRPPTMHEHAILIKIGWLQMYTAFHLLCVKEGQWDGKTLGRAGGVVLVCLKWSYLALWWFKWGQHALKPGAPDGKGRSEHFADTYLVLSFGQNVGWLLTYLFVYPDMPDNQEFVTFNGVAVQAESYLDHAMAQTPPIFVFLFFRKYIFSLLKAPLRKKQRLQDGAFIAALLADDDADDMISEATNLFRGVPFSKVTADLFRSSKGTAADYALSHPCKLNSVDFFVSHSWSDDADQKYANLAAAAADFQHKHGREPILWLDKLCIDQDNIDRALRCLPVFVFSCNRLMILAGNTYCDRLWCVWELYVFFSTSGARALKRVELHDFSDRGTSTLLDFEVANAHCFSPDDEAKLRSIIESGGASDFNDMIREVGRELQTVTGSAEAL